MNRGSYTAATGMTANLRRLDVVTNNMANVNTRAYKADKVSFGESLNRLVKNGAGYGEDVGVLAAGPQENAFLTDFTQGALENTGNGLDLAIKGNGAFAVETPQGVRYTRDGVFSLNAAGRLVNTDGFPVLDENLRPITIGERHIQIEADGAVKALGVPEPVARIGRFQGQFKKEGQNLYSGTARLVTGNNAPEVLTGVVESSNVNTIEMMVEMIALQRDYEMSQKMIQSQDESTSQLLETIA